MANAQRKTQKATARKAATAKGNAPTKTEQASATAAEPKMKLGKLFPVRKGTLRDVAQTALNEVSNNGKREFTASEYRALLAPTAERMEVREPKAGWEKHNFPRWIVNCGWAVEVSA